MPEYDGLLALEKMERAVLKVKERLLRNRGAGEGRHSVCRCGRQCRRRLDRTG